VRAFAEWLSTTAPSVAIQSRFWFIRLLQATHLLTAGVASVSGLMIALRVVGLQRADQPYAAVWARFAPWLAVSFSLMLLTGIAQTLGDPVREFTSFSYWLKLALVLYCVVGTLLLARSARRAPAAADFSFAAKLNAASLIVFWLCIVLLGRIIAYDRAIWGSLSMRT
jgi:uncharacterized membrane protein SirB2